MFKRNRNLELDDLCKVGCGVAIISAILIIIVGFIYGSVWLAFPKIVPVEITNLGITSTVIGTLIIIISIIQIVPLFLCIKLLYEKDISKLPSGITALIFSGIIGGLLILVSYYQLDRGRLRR